MHSTLTYKESKILAQCITLLQEIQGFQYGKPNVAIFNITIFIQFNPYIDLIFLYLFNLIL